MSTLVIFGRPLNSRGGIREKTNVGDKTRAPFQIIYKWTAHWLHSCQCNLADKRNTEHWRTDIVHFLSLANTFARQWTVLSGQLVWQTDRLITNNNQYTDFPGFHLYHLPVREMKQQMKRWSDDEMISNLSSKMQYHYYQFKKKRPLQISRGRGFNPKIIDRGTNQNILANHIQIDSSLVTWL